MLHQIRYYGMCKFFYFLFILPGFQLNFEPASKGMPTYRNNGTLEIIFINVVKNEPMILDEVNYVNVFKESYTISKYKYYVSNIQLQTSGRSFSEAESYHLVDQSDSASLKFSMSVPEGDYTTLSFLLGVDSLHNVSGAQSGALDPVNDMFWTWNSGYVMAKMEGTSPASPLNNVFQYHIGGYSGANKVQKSIHLQLSGQLSIRASSICEISILCDADTWWQQPGDIRISAQPNITSLGVLAKKLSDNYSKMFTIKEIRNESK